MLERFTEFLNKAVVLWASLKQGLDLLRAWPWLAGSMVAVGYVGYVAPQQIGVLVLALSKLSIAAYLGYWLHRAFERGRRPHQLVGAEREASLNRRFFIIGAALIALGLSI